MTFVTGIYQRSISILREMREIRGEMALDEGRGVEEGHLFFLDISPRLKISLHFFQVPSLAGAVDVDEISGDIDSFCFACCCPPESPPLAEARPPSLQMLEEGGEGAGGKEREGEQDRIVRMLN
jgi:hypothetical protein